MTTYTQADMDRVLRKNEALEFTVSQLRTEVRQLKTKLELRKHTAKKVGRKS